VATETWEVGIFSLPERLSARGVNMVNSSERIRLLGRILLNMAVKLKLERFPNWSGWKLTRSGHVKLQLLAILPRTCVMFVAFVSVWDSWLAVSSGLSLFSFCLLFILYPVSPTRSNRDRTWCTTLVRPVELRNMNSHPATIGNHEVKEINWALLFVTMFAGGNQLISYCLFMPGLM
jgi:hypothetical protein